MKTNRRKAMALDEEFKALQDEFIQHRTYLNDTKSVGFCYVPRKARKATNDG